MFVNALQQIRDGATEEAFAEFIQMINDDPKAFINRFTRNAVLLGEGAAGTMNQTQIRDVENSVKEGIKNFTGTSGLRRVPKSFVEKFKIPIPDIEEQKEIVNNVNKQYELISMNKTLIKEHESKINSLINKLYS